MPISRLGGQGPAPSLGDADADAPTGVEPALAADGVGAAEGADATVPESSPPQDADAFGARPNSFSSLRPVSATPYEYDGPTLPANALRFGAPSSMTVGGPPGVALADVGDSPTEAAALLTEAELPGARAVDVDRAATWIDRNAQPESTHKCATFVRRALEAGGFDASGHPVNAKDYGAFLLAKGFTKVDRAQALTPQKGDIVVLQPTAQSNPAGHVAMFDGRQWVSDFRQKDFWGGPAYRGVAAYEVYRP